MVSGVSEGQADPALHVAPVLFLGVFVLVSEWSTFKLAESWAKQQVGVWHKNR